MATLNIGILAHVDAGKTSLTERLLFDTGVIDRLGHVDAGDTQTDSNEIERQRGITIRTAVASFKVGDLQVNLIDTPGHSDFIAEVERALTVLDAAVLVLSAVEGVQPHTRILMKTLRRLRLPTLIFVNKIDRIGARDGELLVDIHQKLGIRVVPLNFVQDLGAGSVSTVAIDWTDPSACTRAAEVLADQDEALLRAIIEEADVPSQSVERALVKQTAALLAHPLIFGSALSGAGVDMLLDAMRRFAPVAAEARRPLRGVVFAMTQIRSGEKRYYVRLFSGELRIRRRVAFWRLDTDGSVVERNGRITSLEIHGHHASAVTAGNIALLAGPADLRVGDRIGARTGDDRQIDFPRPDFESVVTPQDPADTIRLRNALMCLSERDPLMRTRPLPGGGTSVLLYGEVQREVIAATLLDEYKVETVFTLPRIVHVERPLGVGEVEKEGFFAIVRLRIEPEAPGSGITYCCLSLPSGTLLSAFLHAIEDSVRTSLKNGAHGWPVTDCIVTLVHGAYPPNSRQFSTCTGFRRLTHLVLDEALALAKTGVFEPCHRFELEIPEAVLGAVISRLIEFEAIIHETTQHGSTLLILGEIPVRQLHSFKRLLTDLTRGEGVWLSRPEGYRRVNGTTPAQERPIYGYNKTKS